MSAPVQPAPVPGRWWRLAVWACLLVCAALQIGRTPFTADLSAFLPAHPDARQRVLIEQLQSGVAARTLLMAIEGGDSLTRAQASRDLAAELRASGLFEQVQNGQKDGFAEVGTFLFENRYLLSAAVDAQRFTAEGLRQGLLESLSLLGTPAGLLVKPLFERDPTGETLRVGEALVPSSAPRSEHGVWVSRPEASSLPRALLVATSKAAGADLDSQLRVIEAVRQAFTRLQAASSAAVARGEGVAATSGPPLVLRISGAPLFSVESRARIETEVHLLALAGTVLMSAVLLLAFGSLKALGVALLPVLTGVVGGIVAVSLTFGSVHGITLGFGATLIGEAVDYAIYYLMQARAGGWRAWLRDGWPTVRLGLLTSVCGFAALVFSGFPGLAQLGVFSVAGLVSAVLFMRLVLPAFAPDGAAQGGLRRALGLASRRLLSQLPGLRVPLLLLGALALLLVVYQRDRIWEAELGSLSPVSQEALALDASLRADLSAGDASVLVVVRGANLQTTLQAAEEAALQLDRLVEQGAIGGYNSVTRWLPSLQTQQRRQASLPEAAALKSALVAATAGLPLSAERLGPFVADVQSARSRTPVTLESLRGTPLASLAEALLLQRADGSWTALLPLQPLLDAAPGQELDMAAVNKTFQLARPAGPPSTAAPAAAGAEQAQVRSQDALQVIEIGAELKRLYSRYLSEARDQALLGALAVVVLMAFTLRSLSRLLAVCLPLFWAVLLTLGVLVALQVPLGILHLVGLLLVVAVGSNYALFFDMVQQQGQADDDLLASLVLANATTVLGFGLIALSSIPALSALGRVVAPGALLALLLAAAFIPSRVQPLAQKQHG